MTTLVDTSVWSLLLRRDHPSQALETRALRRALEAGEPIVITGLVLQELLQGFVGPRNGAQIIERFAAFPMLTPDRRGGIAKSPSARRSNWHRGCIIGPVMSAPRPGSADHRWRISADAEALQIAGVGSGVTAA